MKKLYDETYEYSNSNFRRTIWYLTDEVDDVIEPIFGAADEYGGRMITPSDYSTMIDAFRELIQNDLNKDIEQKPTETQWIFYSNLVNEDAMGDKVRFSIYIRRKENKFECNINISDFVFAASFDEVVRIRKQIEQTLNSEGEL